MENKKWNARKKSNNEQQIHISRQCQSEICAATDTYQVHTLALIISSNQIKQLNTINSNYIKSKQIWFECAFAREKNSASQRIQTNQQQLRRTRESKLCSVGIYKTP